MLLLATLALAHQVDRLTFAEPAARLQLLVPALSKATGRNLAVSPRLLNTVVIVHVKDRPVGDVLDKIAEVCHGSWSEVKGAMVLERTAEVEAALRRKQSEDCRAAVEQDQSKRRDELAKQPLFDRAAASKLATEIEAWYGRSDIGHTQPRSNDQRSRDYREWDLLMERSPYSRAVRRLVVELPSSLFPTIGPNRRIVLNSKPTRMQRDLGKAGKAALAELVANQATWAAMWKERGEPLKTDVIMGWDPRQRREPFRKQDLRMEVELRHYAWFPHAFEVRMLVTDGKGERVAAANDVVGSFSAIAPAMQDELLRRAAAENPMTVSDRSKEAVAVFGRGYRAAAERPPLSAEWKRRLLDPASYDPLSFWASENIASAADGAGKELIGALPDDVLNSSGVARGPAPKPSEFLLRLCGSGTTAISERDGVLLVQPARPMDAETDRADRKALASFAARVLQEGRVSLRNLAAFCGNQQETAYTSVARRYAATLAPGSTNDSAPTNYDLLRFYARLSDAQRSVLERGASLPWTNLSSGQQAALIDLAFYCVQRPNFSSTSIESAFEAKGRPAFDDITDLLPNGLTAEASVRLSDGRTTILQTVFRDGAGSEFRQTQTVGDLAVHAVIARNMSRLEPEQFLRSIQGIVEGARHDLKFTFELGDGVAMTGRLSELEFDPKAEPMPFEDLPQKSQQRIRDAVAAEQKRRQEFGTPVKQTPPPR